MAVLACMLFSSELCSNRLKRTPLVSLYPYIPQGLPLERKCPCHAVMFHPRLTLGLFGFLVHKDSLVCDA
eukprot:scaffold776_cov347-Pavlova_lutheri.AAC.130